MTMRKFFSTTLILGMLLAFGAIKASAQAGIAPSSQFGIGAGTSGFQLQYAISPAFQLGANFGLLVTSPSVGDGETQITIGPYARFLFEGTVNPFIQAGINIVSGDATTTSLYAAPGLEYFFSRNVGVYGLVGLLDIPFEDGATKTFGLSGGAVGVEWYFNP